MLWSKGHVKSVLTPPIRAIQRLPRTWTSNWMHWLAKDFLAQHWDTEELPKEMNDLLRSRQPAQVAVDDNSIEAVVYKEQQVTKELFEQFHWNLTLLEFGERHEPEKD
jgi:hypothetical protein